MFMNNQIYKYKYKTPTQLSFDGNKKPRKNTIFKNHESYHYVNIV